MTATLLTWVHVLLMVAAFGGLTVLRFAVPPDLRRGEQVALPVTRLCTGLVTAGFLAGVALYVVVIRRGASADLHRLVGIKILLLVALGAVLGAATALERKGRAAAAEGLRSLAMALIACTALLGYLIKG